MAALNTKIVCPRRSRPRVVVPLCILSNLDYIIDTMKVVSNAKYNIKVSIILLIALRITFIHEDKEDIVRAFPGKREDYLIGSAERIHYAPADPASFALLQFHAIGLTSE